MKIPFSSEQIIPRVRKLLSALSRGEINLQFRDGGVSKDLEIAYLFAGHMNLGEYLRKYSNRISFLTNHQNLAIHLVSSIELPDKKKRLISVVLYLVRDSGKETTEFVDFGQCLSFNYFFEKSGDTESVYREVIVGSGMRVQKLPIPNDLYKILSCPVRRFHDLFVNFVEAEEEVSITASLEL